MAEKDREIAEDSKPNLHACVSSLFNSLDSEIPDSSYSLSFPSEPTDIRNWFSSYIYESPASDTGDDFFKGIISRESEIEKEGFAVEKIKKEKEVNLGEFRNTRYRDISLVGEIQSVIKDNHGVEGIENQPALINLFSKRIDEDESLEDKLVQNHDNCPIKDDGNASLNSSYSPQKLEGKFSKEADLILVEIDESSSLKHGNSPKELFDRIDSKEGSSEIKVPTKEIDFRCPKDNTDAKGVTGVYTKKSILQIIEKENETKVFVENGFISTRKTRNTSGNDENSPKRRSQEVQVQVENLKNADTVSAIRKEDAGVGRKALSERTNFQYEAEQETAGKWQCPQKSKPNLGPPLKQLRLERWVHRV